MSDEEEVSPEEETAEITADDLYDNLTCAIEALMSFYGATDEMFLTDYVVVLANLSLDEDGDTEDDVEIIVRNGTVPRYRIKGLLEEARDKLKGSSVNIFMADDGEPDYTDGDEEQGV